MGKIVLFEDERQCCGCGACACACPKNAITMREGAYGQVLPVIDYSKCIECGNCTRICSYKDKLQGSKPFETYAAIANDDSVEKTSSSGGVFACLAKTVIEKNGLISGAAYDYKGSLGYVKHIVGSNKISLDKMKGSKYVQSEAWHSYKIIKEELRNGKIVLFSGTPCQVAALKKYTGNPSNLYTVDLICHGVPSGKMLSEFLKCLQKHLKIQIAAFSFRSKNVNSAFCAEIATKKGKKIYVTSHYLSFYRYFLNSVIYRENCYSCPYAQVNRVGDLTIGDYWGLEKSETYTNNKNKIDISRSWSCILVNSEKGKALLDLSATKLSLFESNLDDIVRDNKQLQKPSEAKGDRGKILSLFAEKGYKAVENDYIKTCDGKVRYFWRLFKNIRLNNRGKKE